MPWIKPRTPFITFCLASLLGVFVSGLPMRTLAQHFLPQVQKQSGRTQSPPRLAPRTSQTQNPTLPNVGLPGRRKPGGGRSSSANEQSNEKSLTALVPETNLGLTVAPYPTFFFYIPQTSATAARFVLLDEENGHRVYEKTFTIPKTPGIVSLSLPAETTIPPLEVGKNYHWYFHIIFPSEESDQDLGDMADSEGIGGINNIGNIYVDGWVQRVEATPTLISQLEKVSSRERVALYRKDNIWHDALKTLAEQHRLNPNDSAIATEWANLLRSIGLDEIAQEPLILH